MVLIFSIILMCSYLYSVCSGFRVLKNIYFNQLLSLVASKYSICNIKNNTQELNCVQCSIIAPLEKALWPRWNIPSQFIDPMKKSWFYERLFFEVIVMVKDKKIRYKRQMSIKISFKHYMKWTKVMLPVVFEEFGMVYIFFSLLFAFRYHCQLVKGQLQQKSRGTAVFTGL